MNTEIPINKFITLFLDEYKRKNYAPSSIAHVELVVNEIALFHSQRGEAFFNEAIIEAYVANKKILYDNQKLHNVKYLLHRRTAIRMCIFNETGKLDVRRLETKKPNMSPYYYAVIDFFAQNTQWNKSMHSRVKYTANRHFEWLTANHVNDIGQVTHEILRAYLSHCSGYMSGNGLKHTMYLLKIMYRYLYETGRATSSFDGMLSFPVSKSKKFKPALPEEEVSKILNSIDRSTQCGKRGYAILILAYTTGLRSSDIVSLKFDDIDWQKGEIRIIQQKTGKPLVLPLTEDVGKAVEDYVLNGRPKSESHNIFLRTKAPYQALSSRCSLGSAYEAIRRDAGLKRKAHDGKSFHAFRRSVGKNMVVAGVGLFDLAQILGHSDLMSVKDYIPLDNENLKSCALDFGGIKAFDNNNVCQYSCALDFSNIAPIDENLCAGTLALDFSGIKREER